MSEAASPSEKKWFVYLGDHHEGPFSQEEIREKMGSGQVTSASYVWAEGMADWKVMTEVDELASLQSGPSPQAADSPRSGDSVEVAPESVAGEPALGAPVEAIAEAAAAGDAGLEAKKPGPKRRGAKALFFLLILVALAGGIGTAYNLGYLDSVLKNPTVVAVTKTAGELVQPQLLKLAEKFPFLGKWISPIPAIHEISPEEFEALKASARGRVEEGGAKVGIALAATDPADPSIYVSSNLPDGAVIDVHVIGIGDTLLNQLSFTGRETVVINRRIGKTKAIRYPDGQPIPRGEYLVYALDAEGQPDSIKAILAASKPVPTQLPAALPKGRKLAVFKQYFLGGKKDAIYAERLKEFHDKLREKATAELAEARQHLTTIEAQFQRLSDGFEKTRSNLQGLAKKKAKPKALAALRGKAMEPWIGAGAEWRKMYGQLSESYLKWTPEAIEKDFFHGAAFALVRKAGETADKAYSIRNSVVAGTADASTADSQLAETVAAAQAAIEELKAKVEELEKIPPSPNGMPRRNAE